MTIIKQQDFIQSIADAFQYISYYHPLDYIQALGHAWEIEQSAAAKDAIAQILVNSRMSAEGKRPICQDTGIAVVFLEIGMDIQWSSDCSIEDMVNEGVRIAYTNSENTLRASVVSPPYGLRKNTGDNTPAVIHMRLVPGNKVDVKLAAKGGGSENKAKFGVLNPSDDLVEWVVKNIPPMGAGWCPPGILGIGIGGTAEKAMLLAKESLMAPVDMQDIKNKKSRTATEELRLSIFEKVNDLGIGAQGLGGLTTVLDVKIKEYATHAASLPVAIIPNCAATRHIHFILDGSGPVELPVPSLNDWPAVTREALEDTRRVDLNVLNSEEVKTWKAGERLLLSGKLLTGRDAAHKRIQTLLDNGESLPDGVDFTNRAIYYVGPVDPVGNEVVGPAGPTTATRMDKFTDMMLDKTGLLVMVGKAERGAHTIESIKQHQAAYLMAVGGAAYLVSKAIIKAKVIAFEELGMEAIYEFDVHDMPVTVAVDAKGNSVHQSGPVQWKNKYSELI